MCVLKPFVNMIMFQYDIRDKLIQDFYSLQNKISIN
jgi:hypothetical protein